MHWYISVLAGNAPCRGLPPVVETATDKWATNANKKDNEQWTTENDTRLSTIDNRKWTSDHARAGCQLQQLLWTNEQQLLAKERVNDGQQKIYNVLSTKWSIKILQLKIYKRLCQ